MPLDAPVPARARVCTPALILAALLTGTAPARTAAAEGAAGTEAAARPAPAASASAASVAARPAAPLAAPDDSPDPAALLPDAATVQRWLAGQPGGASLDRAEQAAEVAGRDELRAGPHAWTVGASLARRQLAGLPGRPGSVDLGLSLSRGLRLPGKAAAAEALGDARLALAAAQARQRWREQARALLDAQIDQLAAALEQRLLQHQAQAQAEEARALARRVSLGDAAAQDARLAEAASLRLQAQQALAAGRLDAARALLQRRFGATPPPVAPADLPPPPQAATPAPSPVDRPVPDSPEAEVLQAERAVLAAQLALDRLERQPDPSLGLDLGQARLDRERSLGLSLSLPLGGAGREAAVRASLARLDRQDARLAEQRQRDAAERARDQAALAAQHAAWQRARQAAEALDAAARVQARSQALGESSQAETLAARRLAQEQALQTEQLALAGWALHWRLALAQDRLWPAPARP